MDEQEMTIKFHRDSYHLSKPRELNQTQWKLVLLMYGNYCIPLSNGGKRAFSLEAGAIIKLELMAPSSRQR